MDDALVLQKLESLRHLKSRFDSEFTVLVDLVKNGQPDLLLEIQLQDPNDAIVQAVFDKYCKLMNRNPKIYTLTVQRLMKGKARLRECLIKSNGDLTKASALLNCAVTAMYESDWHMGRDPKTDGRKYNDWDLIFRSAGKFEEWLVRDNGVRRSPNPVIAREPGVYRERPSEVCGFCGGAEPCRKPACVEQWRVVKERIRARE